MSNDPTPDEQPKQQIAKKVITPKRKYFLPDYGYDASVEAATLEEAQKKASQAAQENGNEQ